MVDLNQWLLEAKADPSAAKCGMYLTHNGVVRETAKAQVRQGVESAPVTGMFFSYDKEKVDAAIEEAYTLPGIYYIRVWLAEGELSVGDDIMYVLIGGDIRPHVIDGLQFLVGKIKSECVKEIER
ncbi:MAG: molybdenum cofactor biosynthesis protein MoaE [Clostridia bacterium]|nr:molybdenum cofactor biosynthesis protein MoaE [Clostridia bacterium]MBR5991466.1 molybdenum cofactor biosynthesis protein MoaE [Clostridia bacterium]